MPLRFAQLARTRRPKPRRNLVAAEQEAFKPPIFRSNIAIRNRIENVVHRFADRQFGSAWRDLRGELSTASGALIDIGCGAQVFRPLIPGHVSYYGPDTADSRSRFGFTRGAIP